MLDLCLYIVVKLYCMLALIVLLFLLLVRCLSPCTFYRYLHAISERDRGLTTIPVFLPKYKSFALV